MKLLASLKNSRYMQYLAATSVTVSIASAAMYNTWSSPSIPKLVSDDSPIGVTLTDNEATWVASSFLMGTIPATPIIALFIHRIGRRTAFLLCATPIFIPWIVCAFATSAWALIISRFIAGMGGGLAMTVVPIYVGEISDKDIRGKLGTAFNILKLSGSLYILSVGPFVSYKALTLSCSVFPLIFVTMCLFIPESPYYLVRKGNPDEAEMNLIRLSKKNAEKKEIISRMDEIANTVEYDMKNKSTLWEFLSKPEYRKSLIVMFCIKTLQQLSGMNGIDAYIQTIIGASSSSISEKVSSIICGFVQIPAVLIAAALVDKMGRKPLLFISSLGCAVALTAEGIYFYLQDVAHADVSSISWLPTTALVLYLIMNPIGVFTLPYVLLGELFATNIKEIAVSVAAFYGGSLAFLVVKFFDPISAAWGMHTMFWIFAGVCYLGAAFAIFVLPETKGKTFAEIQEKLNRNRRIQSNDVE